MADTKNRAPEFQAASAVIELGKLEAAIAASKKRTAEKEAAHAAILKGLTPDVRVLVERLRGKTA